MIQRRVNINALLEVNMWVMRLNYYMYIYIYISTIEINEMNAG